MNDDDDIKNANINYLNYIVTLSQLKEKLEWKITVKDKTKSEWKPNTTNVKGNRYSVSLQANFETVKTYVTVSYETVLFYF